MLNFPDAPIENQEFVASPKATFTWTPAPDRWRRRAAPLLTLTSLVPDWTLLNVPTTQIDLNGTEFTLDSDAVLDGVRAVSVPYSDTLLRHNMDASAVEKTVQIHVNDPTKGDSNKLPFRYLTVAPDAPYVFRIDPDSVLTNTAISAKVYGQMFTSACMVYLGSTLLTTTFVSATELTVAIPASATTGAHNIVVTDGVTNWPSGVITFTYEQPPLVITSLIPGAVLVGTISGGGPNVDINGSGFNSNCWIWWNGLMSSTTYVSPTKLIANAVENRTVGTFPVYVKDNQTQLLSNTVDFYVTTDQPPQLLSVSPNSAVQGTTIPLLTVTGVNFVNGKRIKLGEDSGGNGKPVATTYVNATTLTCANVFADYGAPRIKVTVEDCPGEVAVTLTSTSFQIRAGPTPDTWPYYPHQHPYVGDIYFGLDRNIGDNNQCKVILTHKDTGERYVLGTYADFQGNPSASWFSPYYFLPVPPRQWFWMTIEIGGVSSANRKTFSLIQT